jgi:hypothetical protein
VADLTTVLDDVDVFPRYLEFIYVGCDIVIHPTVLYIYATNGHLYPARTSAGGSQRRLVREVALVGNPTFDLA